MVNAALWTTRNTFSSSDMALLHHFNKIFVNVQKKTSLVVFFCDGGHDTEEPTIAGDQCSVGRISECSAHEAKTGASVEHVEVDRHASPQNFSHGGHHI